MFYDAKELTDKFIAALNQIESTDKSSWSMIYAMRSYLVNTVFYLVGRQHTMAVAELNNLIATCAELRSQLQQRYELEECRKLKNGAEDG